MTLSEVAEDVRRNPHKYCGGATHIEARQVFGVVEAFEADPEFTLPTRVVEARDLIQKDPHDWSRRPCATCARMSELLGVSFGCHRLREILMEGSP